MNKSGKGERLFPEHVHHVLKIVGPLLDEALVSVERIRVIATLAFEIGDDVRNGEFRFPQSGRKAEGEDWIDEAMRIADTNEPLPAKASHLVRVIWNHVHLFDIFQV